MKLHPARERTFLDAQWLVAAILTVALGAVPALAQSPDFTDVDDILEGRRVLVDVADLLAVEPHPNGSGSSTTPSRLVLYTDDGKIVSETASSDGVRNCEPSNSCINPFPQQERIVRLFSLPHEVKVAAVATANATGTDCQGPNNLAIRVDDLVTGSSTMTVLSASNAFLQLGVGDFDFDGMDDLVLINSVEMFAFNAQDVDDPTAGIARHAATQLPAAGYRALGEPTVGDVNADGIRDLVWAGGSENGAQYLYVASVCPGDIPDTVCSGAQPFDIIVDPLSFERVELVGTSCGGPAATAGDFLPETGDEVLAVFGNSSCNAQARLLRFDGEMQATEVGQVGVGSDTGTMLAQTVRFDWFNETDQAVVVSEGVAIVGQNPILIETRTVLSVITFASNGTMTTHQVSSLKESTPIVRGLATGVFGPPPGGFQDPADFVPQIAVLRILAEATPENVIEIYDVDPDAGYVPQLSSTYVLPSSFEVYNECGHNFAGSLLQAGDLQGRSVRVGEPEIIRVTQASQPQIILGTPPMHVAYVKLDRNSSDPPEIVNFTTIPDAFKSSFQTMVTDTAQSSNQSTTSYATATKKTDSSTLKVSFGKVASASETTKQVQSQTHDESVSQAYNTYTSESFDASTSTGFGDQIWFTAERFNIYAYPVIGQTACPAEDPSCDEPEPLYMLFSGPDEISRETVNATAVEWYQPVHQPGQVFSYPWSMDQLEQRTGDLLLLTGLGASFYTDDSLRTVQVTWSEQQGMDATSSTVDTYSQETDKSTSASATLEKTVNVGVGETESVETGTSDSFETLNSSSTVLGAATGIGVDKPDSFLDPAQYQYRVEPFVFGEPPPGGTAQSIDLDTDIETTGVLQTAFVADPTDSLAGPWWASSPYVQFPDVALNHPRRWGETLDRPTSTSDLPASCLPLSLTDTQASCLSINDPDPDDIWTSEFYWMRGLLVTVGGTAGSQRTTAEEGDDVFLQARVYNYSLAEMQPGTEVHARFYRQQWDHTTNLPLGDSVLIGERTVDPIPPFDTETDTTAPNWQVVSVSFDTTGMGDAYWIFWVVVWLEDGSGNLVAELPGHGLESIPGTLRAVGDAPIEMVTITDLNGDSKTTSFSNNVGFLNSAFYVAPSASSVASAETEDAASSGVLREAILGLENLEVFPDRVETGGVATVRAVVSSPEAPSEGVLAFLYDGDPDDGGEVFDVETLSRVRASDSYEVRVPYHPTGCGTRTIVLLVNPSRPSETRLATTLEVACEPPPDDGDADDDSCRVGRGSVGPGSWLLLAGALFLLSARASQVPRARGGKAISLMQ